MVEKNKPALLANMHNSVRQFVSVTGARFPRVLVLAGVLLLGACASTPTKPPPQKPEQKNQEQRNQAQKSQEQQEQQKQNSAKQAPAKQKQGQAKGGQEQKQQSQRQQQKSGEANQQYTPGQDQKKAGQPAQKQSGQASGAQQRTDQEKAPGQRSVSQAPGTSQSEAAATSGGQARTPARPGPPGAQTRGERDKQLQGEFDRSLGAFDERLSREQGELKTLSEKQTQADQQRAAQQASQGGSAAGLGGEQIGRAGAPPPPNGGSDSSDNSSPRNRGPGSPGDRANLPPTPDDIPSGQNDDVVARQLREAAENETDPEVRKKLWDEYRKYKKSNG